MSNYNSKHTGKEVDDAIDMVAMLTDSMVDYVTKSQLENAIAQAITTTLNTEV